MYQVESIIEFKDEKTEQKAMNKSNIYREVYLCYGLIKQHPLNKFYLSFDILIL